MLESLNRNPIDWIKLKRLAQECCQWSRVRPRAAFHFVLYDGHPQSVLLKVVAVDAILEQGC